MIDRKEMQEVVKRYRDPIGVVLGSHSALDAWAGLRDYGVRSLIYTTKHRAEIYFREPRAGRPKEDMGDLPGKVRRDLIVAEDIQDIVRKKKGKWRAALLLMDSYKDVLKSEVINGLIELEGIQIPNRAFAVYVGDYACKKIEDDFPVPILGSRGLLKMENREEVKKNYYWYLKEAGIPHPKEFKYKVVEDGIKFSKKIDQPVVLKIPHAQRRLERGFMFSSNSSTLEEDVEKEFKAGRILREDLEVGRAEEYVPGVTANLNFFYSPINAEEDWGSLERYEKRTQLANEFLSVDERRETTHDGVLRLPAREQLNANWNNTPYPNSFEVTAHSMVSLRESLLRKIYPVADAFVELTQKTDPPGMIGAYCIQTLITFAEKPYVEAVSQGVYDASGVTSLYDFVPMTQDIAVRHGGGTNVHMGVGSQYANAKYQRTMSMGDRIALEIKRARAKRKLDKIVT
ncbi:MAG TPA: DUF1297 domain-containing protein [Candidatus Bathyarchaeia archaeon]|nr:DUF1297 domain-containing protein [Candidatus Bathyarchaeia archaeon]